jgi:hypothetical protein
VKMKYPRTIIYERPTTSKTRQGTHSRQSYPCAPYFRPIDSFGKTDELQRISVHRSVHQVSGAGNGSSSVQQSFQKWSPTCKLISSKKTQKNKSRLSILLPATTVGGGIRHSI